MSSTRKPGNAHDTHPTPIWTVRRFLEAFPLRGASPILEPCAGDGAILRGLTAHFGHRRGPRLVAIELRYDEGVVRRLAGSLDGWDGFVSAGLDIFAPRAEKLILKERPRFAITNPPFAIAEKLVDLLWRDLQIPTALLLPVNWVGGHARKEWMLSYGRREREPDLYVLPDRPSFTADGGKDSQNYAWFVWGADIFRREARWELLGSTSKEERKADRLAQFGAASHSASCECEECLALSKDPPDAFPFVDLIDD